MMSVLLSSRSICTSLALHRSSEGLVPRVPMGVLLSIIHLLFECLCFLLIYKAKPGKAVFEFEGMKKDAILVVREGVVDFLVPDDAAVRGRHIDELDPEGVSHQVVGQDCCPLQTRVGPSVPVRIGDVELRNGDSMDLVRGLRDRPLDGLLIFIRKDGRHGGERVVLPLAAKSGCRGCSAWGVAVLLDRKSVV